MTETKLCKDCEWCERVGLFRTVKTYAFCLHPASCTEISPNIVTGEQIAKSWNYCAVMRLSHQPCADDSKLFEPKPVNWLRSLCSSLFRRKIEWNALDNGKSATVKDELARLNNER